MNYIGPIIGIGRFNDHSVAHLFSMNDLQKLHEIDMRSCEICQMIFMNPNIPFQQMIICMC